MRIVNLIENTEGVRKITAAHGLSFYIETKKHRLLMDLGPSEKTIDNAEKLGIDLNAVDSVILSHGHYDHSGGIRSFAQINDSAPIYMQETAFGEYYSSGLDEDGNVTYRYIGIDRELENLLQIIRVRGDHIIDDELELFTVKSLRHRIPFTNRRILVRSEGRYIQDDFRHEHSLVIHEGDRDVVMSGCAHCGVLNILSEYRSRFGRDPYALISGFHLMKKSEYRESEIREIQETARELSKYNTKIYTCHCTGERAFDLMKAVMGQQLDYIHSGDELTV